MRADTEPDVAVLFREGKVWTLQEVFQSLGLTVDTLSVDTLELSVSVSRSHNFVATLIWDLRVCAACTRITPHSIGKFVFWCHCL